MNKNKKIIIALLLVVLTNSVFAVKVEKEVFVEVCGGKLGETTVPNGPFGTCTTIICGKLVNEVCFTYKKRILVDEAVIPIADPYEPVSLGTYAEIYTNGNMINSGTVNTHIINVFYPNINEITHVFVLVP